MNNKGAGLVSGLVAGVGSLVILTILIFVVISTVQNANLLGADSTASIAVVNETGAWLNNTAYELAAYNSSNSNFALTAIWAYQTGAYNISVPLVNASLSTASVLNATTITHAVVSYSYTYTYTFDNNYKASSDHLGNNLTVGVDNISSKVPTVLLIAAVVLLFGVLAILVIQSRKAGLMNSGGGNL